WWAQSEYRLQADDRVLQKTPFGFDVSVWEFFLPLLAGARLVMARPGGHQDPSYLTEVVARERITTMHFVPSMIPAFLTTANAENCASLRRILCSGEALPHSAIVDLANALPHVEVHNLYGPTEAAVDVTAWPCKVGQYGQIVPIGRPIANTQMYVLDKRGEPVPVGVEGELFIGGVQVARGYLNRPELTTERFLVNPFAEGRLYKTGDLGRWLPDGNIEYRGRNDFQVKLRGFRIELGEIEARLVQCDGVREAVVVAREDANGAASAAPGDKRLVAYLVGSDLSIAELRATLAAHLPEYMVPSAMVVLEALPLSANGKLDRKALPAPDATALAARVYEAPQGDVETALAAIWQDLLGVPQAGRHDDFFALGGHSLLAVQVLSRIRAAFGVELPLRAVFASSTLSALAAAVSVAGASTMERIQRADRTQALPLSLAQQRLWFLDQLDKQASAGYHMASALRLTGRLDADALQATLDRVVARHEVLRTSFVAVDGIPYQHIAPASTGFALRREDLRHLSDDQRDSEVARITHHESRAPFDLTTGPLIRGTLLRVAGDEHVLLITQHHIISDGWSLNLLVQEVATLYAAFVRGEADPLPELEIQYADYAQWQRSWLQGEELARQLDFWKGHLTGAPALLSLPLDRPRPAVQSVAGAMVPVALPPALTAGLRAFSQRHGVTLFMTLLSAWGALLSRLSGQQDVVVGTPVANRQRREVESLIGFFVNTLALRLRFDDQPSVAALLAQIKETTLAAFAHQELPFEQIVDAVQPQRSLSHSPLFQTMLAFNNTSGEQGQQQAQNLPDLKLAPAQEALSATAQYELSLNLNDGGDALFGTLTYASDLFDHATVERWAGQFVRLLEAMAADASTTVGALPLLSAADREQLLAGFNATDVAVPNGLIHELFEQHAAARPDAVAIVFEDRTLTYAELNARANQLAHSLIARGVGSEDRVAVLLDRGVDLVVSFLGILKAGGVYVPVDAAYPAERVQFMLDDAAPKVVLTDLGNLSAHPAHNPQLPILHSHLAYVIYTSGSTGLPKGVMVEHRGVTNLGYAQSDAFGLDANGRVLQFASPAFDASVSEFVMTFACGATLCLASRDAMMPGQPLLATLRDLAITHVTLPPTALAACGDAELPALQTLVVAGEACPPALAERWHRKVRFVNAYGPTETTVCASAQHCDVAGAQTVPIGRPIANTKIYILDANRQPVPVGVEGELYIGGIGVARGYRNRPDLTAERFVSNPFHEGTMYKTGDLGRWLPDGTIEYLGRNDFQVKVRGFRIELGEIEAKLDACAGVRESVVIAREDVPGDKRLVAYVVGSDLSIADLRNALSAQLPEYMVPAAFVQLDAIPVTSNGKVDRKALPAPDGKALAARHYEAPQGEVETQLAAIWAELLRVQRVGRQDNFFELGGHSLLAVQVISRIRTALGVDLALRDFFAAGSLQALAEAAQSAGASTLGRIGIADRNQPLPLSLAQQRLWFLDQLDQSASVSYNMPAALRLLGNLDVAALQATLDRVVARHEILRTRFVAIEGQPYQQIAPADCGFALQREDLRQVPAGERQAVVAGLAAAEASTPFDLSAGPLVRGRLLTLAVDEYVLLLTQHHIVTDGWSMGILVREVAELYTAFRNGEADPLQPLEIQYADYAVWQRNWLQGEELARQLAFWRDHLTGAPALLELPLDRPRPAVQTHAGGGVSFSLSPSLTARLEAFSQRHGATLFMTLLSAWGLLLSRLSGQQDVVIGTSVANRQRAEVEGLIGFFVNTLAMRLRFGNQPSVASLLAQVKETTLAAFAHQELPFEQIVEAVQPQRSLAHSPLFQSSFTLNNTPDGGALDLPELTLAPVESSHDSTHFDLSLSARVNGERLEGAISYAAALFDRETVARWAAHFETLLEAMVDDDAAPVDALPLLSAETRQELLRQSAGPVTHAGREQLLPVQIEEQAVRTPSAIALRSGAHTLSYAELNARANRLAHHLIEQGVGRGARVGVSLGRSIELLIAQLAIMKTGAAYVPLDPRQADARQAAIVRDAGLDIILSPRTFETVPLDGYSAANPAVALSAADTIYVLYTSGSTGEPKGVDVYHGGVIDYCAFASSNYYGAHLHGSLVATSPAFDLTLPALYVPLLRGGCVELLAEEDELEALSQWLANDAGAVLLRLTPSHVQALLTLSDDRPLQSAHVFVIGGEAFEPAVARRLQAKFPDSRIYNHYGPTETVVGCAWFDVTANLDALQTRIPIGRPMENTALYVVDPQGRLQPLGVPGELYIGGAGVARGYLNRPEQTAEKFIANPFGEGRVYRSGDQVRLRAGGNLEFLGRIDRQVKLRGFRIELGEIESRLKQSPHVQDAVVQLSNDHLIAWVVPASTNPQSSILNPQSAVEALLHAELSTHLPSYMLPAAYVWLEALPLTVNGKVDLHALPAPQLTALRTREYESPQGDVEETIAGLWQSLLRVERAGRHDDFFALGGHSLLAVQLVSRLRAALNVELPLRALFETPTLSALAGAVRTARTSTMGRILPADRSRPLPLSLAQQRLWFIDQLDKTASAAYHMPAALRLVGSLNVSALQATLDRLVARHESLRTRFVAVDGVPYQQIAPADCGFALLHEDLSALSGEDREAAVAALAADEARAPFDLAAGPLTRGRLVRLAEDEHVLLITQHHIVSDGWSRGLMLREVAAVYAAFSRGEADPLPPLEIQYADYAQWQRGWLQGEELTRQFQFWKDHLTGAPALLALPLDRPRPAVQSHAGATLPFTLSPELTADLRSFAQRHGATVFMTLVSAWGLLLSRLSGQQDVVVGTPVANRQRSEVESLIGFFVNTVALRLRFDEQPSVAALLEQVKETTLAAFAHQELPFEQVVEAVQPQRSLSHSPLFQTIVALNIAADGDGEPLTLPDLRLAPVTQEATTAQYELSLHLSDGSDALSGLLVYSTALFDHATIERWAGHFVTLLEAMVADAAAGVATLPLLPAAERRQLLAGFNATEAAYPQETLIHELFERQAALQPDAVAVVCEGRSLTYGELNARANQLAHELIARGVQPDDRVAISMERSLDMIVALLGTLKAGGAYVPLDPAYPAERLQYLIEDSAPKVVLTEEVLCQLPEGPASNPVTGVTARNLAYIIYTSGSTGLPKGVAIEHRNTANLLYWALENFAAGELANTLFATSINFDLAVWELFVPLAAGRTVTLVKNALALAERPEPVTLVNTVPSAIKALLDAGGVPATVQLVNLAGEPLKRDLAERLFAETATQSVANLYGPSETTTYSTWVRMSREQGFDATIGRPIANTQIYILDAHGQPVPVGVAGEIYIGGDGVARGYLNRPELTAERFLRDPFAAAADARMYKTGDLGRWLPDGTIEYLGRNDFQVKIRGFRIELGEIETRLVQCAGVREAVVIAREDVPGDKRLVAYLVAADGALLDAAAPRASLLGVLPEYMIPSAFVQLDAMPLTSNGKLDRKALPVPEATALSAREYEAPQAGIEEQVAAIWRQLLRVERVGRHDNFFELGGHSLLAVQLTSRVRAALGVSLELRDVFTSPTLQAMAAAARSAAASDFGQIAVADRNQPLPLSLAQQRLWFLDQLDKSASVAYHMPVALRLHGSLDVAALQATLDRLVARHETLRTRFVAVDGVPYQQIAPEDAGFALTLHDLRGLDEESRERVVAELAADEARAPFDLGAGPLIRGVLLAVADDEHVLLITQHHIVSDGWSMGILVREVATLYTAFRRGESDPLPPLEIQYADYAQWQRNWLRGEELARQFAFWKDHLAGAPSLLALPLDRPRPALQSYAGASVPVVLSAELTAALRTISQQHGTTLFMTLLSAWGLLLSRLSGQSDVVIGTPVANRQRREVEGLIGFFVNTLALRLRFDEQASVTSLFEQVKETTLAAFAHQELPFEQVVDAAQVARSLNASPLFQALLAFNASHASEGDGALELPELKLAPVGEATEAAAKYDLSLHFNDGGEALSGVLVYASDLFDRATIERWAGHFVTLLEAMAADVTARAAQLPLLSAVEREQVVVDFNATSAAYPSEALIHELFERQVAAQPDAVAIVFEDQRLTYAELNARANQLAHELIARGVQPDDRVAIKMERSLDTVVAMLGTLKAGGAYVPLDPSYPADRLRYLIEDSAPKVVLTADVMRALSARPTSNPDAPGLTSRNLADIIYTSGSTGLPKGVMVDHRCVNRLVLDNPYFTAGAGDCFAHCANPAFDAATWEIWGALLNGARLLVVPSPVVMDPARLDAALVDGGVTLLWLTVGLFNQYVDSLPNAFAQLQTLMVGGDALDPKTIRQLLRSGHRPRRVLNGYGPTETTTFAITHEIVDVADDARSIPLGRPIANTQVYILDAHGQPVPVGVEGELYIGGDGVARGYLNRAELTAERFLANPFAEGTMYRTGDLGRWLPNGTIEFLGRNDFQVKLRGFRIELGEIETRLSECAGVREAVVIAREDVPGDKRLVAYLVAVDGAALDAAELRASLLGVLPEYMVPAAFVQVDAMPLTSNGKLDRKALPAPELTALSSRQYEAPQGAIEEQVAEIWRQLLHVQRVGRHDNFFELGGHSLLAVQLISRIRAVLGVDVELRTLFVDASLQAVAVAVQNAASSTLGRIEIADRNQPLPLSLAQQRLWFLDQLDKAASVAYHIPAALRLRGTLDVAALQATLDRLVARHEALRTRFVAVDGVPYQQIVPEDSGFTLAVHDLRALDDESRDRAVAEYTAAEAREPFDLSTGPLIRGQLLRVADDEHVLLITQHHIVSDGWSINILVREVASLYTAFHGGESDPLPPLEIQYPDYALWQRNWLRGDELARQTDFWKEHFAGAPALLDLPLDRPRPALQTYAGDAVPMVLSAELTSSLRSLARQQGVTLFMTLLSAWGVLLSRLSGQQDVVIGTPVANRQRREVENLIGFFVNTLALRLRPDEQSTVALLGQVKETTLAAFAHQELPFEQVVEAAQVTRSISHSPLFQAMLAFNNTSDGEGEGASLPDLQLVPARKADGTTAQYDLALHFNDGEELAGVLVYASDLFDRATIERWAGCFVTLLEAMAANVTAPTAQLPLLSEDERRHVLALNATDVAYPKDTLIHELFERQAALQPDAVAVVFEERSLTYGQLNARANQLAHELIARGVRPDDRVAISMERSLDMIVALLGTLKAGGAYVPLDPAYPAERLRYLIEDSAPKVVLTEDVLRQLPKHPATNPDPRALGLSAASLAYIIYTSGSTGLPKGVAIEHRNTANLLHWALENFTAEELANTLFATSINFDLAVWELFVPLAAGRTVTLVNNALALADRPEPVTLVNTVPSAIKALLDAGGVPPSVQLVNLAGEPLKRDLVERLFAETATRSVANLYGPSETTTYSTWVRMSREQGFDTTIGRPIANTRIYILDAHGQPVPVGVAGEIHIGGDGVARGYLNRPELTAERFLRDPFAATEGARMYKTGDLGRWLPDGTIEYLGRNDFQVKIRGFRIELGEIEARLVQCPGVNEAVVIAREDLPGDKRLVAYLVAADDAALDAAELRASLLGVLPEYMIPSAFVQLDAMPLTSNGKLDRKALPAPEAIVSAAREYEAPQGEIEETLAAMWQELLRIPRVSRHDAFFELGGHSLLVVQLIHRLQAQTPYRLAVRDLFQHPSLAALAAHIAATATVPAGEWTPLTRLSEGDDLPVLHVIPDAGKTAASWQPLADALHGKVAVHAFQPRGIDGAHPFSRSVEETAAVNLRALLAEDADGPYWLAGHAFGGAVAFEMARALEQQGRTVHLCILDTPPAPPDRAPEENPEVAERLRALGDLQTAAYSRYVPSGPFTGHVTRLSGSEETAAGLLGHLASAESVSA
ncbi:MAG TPA: non-ribosomal peptide synthase/polyketide synthase, partial [Thermoanaerobaculia bacterium]|nr:non-ribosomal peptide synthase/polyketide synthase [Thermoanaerobaculia bacterium]